MRGDLVRIKLSCLKFIQFQKQEADRRSTLALDYNEQKTYYYDELKQCIASSGGDVF